jgi:hypothetical protein
VSRAHPPEPPPRVDPTVDGLALNALLSRLQVRCYEDLLAEHWACPDRATPVDGPVTCGAEQGAGSAAHLIVTLPTGKSARVGDRRARRRLRTIAIVTFDESAGHRALTVERVPPVAVPERTGTRLQRAWEWLKRALARRRS